METIYKTYEVCKSKQIHSLLLLEDMLNSKQKKGDPKGGITN